VRLYSRELELYDEPALLAELRRLGTRLTAGSSSVVNPRVGGSHGDLAQALALAVYHYGPGGGPVPMPTVRERPASESLAISTGVASYDGTGRIGGPFPIRYSDSM
jgi:hypothetical protein